MHIKRFRTWGFLLVSALLVGGFFYKTIFYNKLPVPADTLVGLYHPWRDVYAESYPRGVPYKNFLITDPIRQQIPWRKVGIDAWKNGKLPSWNPYTFMGTPLDANIQAAPFYPLNALFMFLEFSVAWTILVMLQPLLSGVFMYMYLRRHELTPFSAGVGSVSWAFGGFAVSWMTWGTIVHAALWLPLMMISIDEITATHKKISAYIRWGMLLALGMVMTVLAGHIQVAAYSILMSVMYFAYKAGKPSLWKSIWAAISAGLVAVVVTSIQWAPLVRFMADSGRVASLDAWKKAGWFLPLPQLVQFFAPDFFGNPATLNYWGEWNYGEFIGYIGVIPIILACSALLVSGMPRFFAVSAGVALMFMISNPVSRLPFLLHIPILSVLQPTRLMVVLDISLSILAAIGLDRFIKGTKRQVHVSAGLFGMGLVVLWGVVLGAPLYTDNVQILEHFAVAKRNLIIPTVFMAGLFVWLFVYAQLKNIRLKNAALVVLFMAVVFDVYRFGWKYTPFTSVEFFFPKTRIITYLESQPKPFRVMSLDDRILPPNVSSYYGIESIEGYDPITSWRYEAFLGASERGNADATAPSGFNRIYTAHNIDSTLLPYLNVRYVLALTDVKRPFLREVMREGDTRLYENTRRLPRVYFPDMTQRANSATDELSGLFAANALSVGITDRSVNIMNIPLTGNEAAEITEYSSTHIRIKAQTVNERLLVILHQYDDRWKATIDGKNSDAKTLRVNYLFTGVVVPAGTHDIILSYR